MTLYWQIKKPSMYIDVLDENCIKYNPQIMALPTTRRPPKRTVLLYTIQCVIHATTSVNTFNIYLFLCVLLFYSLSVICCSKKAVKLKKKIFEIQYDISDKLLYCIFGFRL